MQGNAQRNNPYGFFYICFGFFVVIQLKIITETFAGLLKLAISRRGRIFKTF